MSWPGWRARSTTSSCDATTAADGGRCSSSAVLSTRSRRMLATHGREARGKQCSAQPPMHYAGARHRSLSRAIGAQWTSRRGKACRSRKLAARMFLRAYPAKTPPSLELSRRTDHIARIKHFPACSVEEIAPDDHCVVARLDRQAAMNALRPVHDGVDVTATAPATIVAVKATTFQEQRRDVAHLGKTD